MLNLFKMELYNLKHLKSFKALLLINFVIGLLYTISMPGSTTYRTGIGGFEASFSDLPLMCLFCSMLVGLFIGSGFSDRTINYQIAIGKSRFKIMTAKIMVYYLATIPTILLYPVLVAIIQTIRFGWGEPFMATHIAYVLRVIILSVLLNIGVCSFFVFITFLLKTMAASIVASAVFYFLVSAIYKLTPTLEKIMKYTPFYLSTQAMNREVSEGQIIISILSSILCTSVMFFVTYFFFKKSELK